MLDINGYEIPDNTPVEMPTRLRLPQSRAAQIQGFIRAEMSRQASDNGNETFEEANDLDVEDNADFPPTAYERSGEFGFADMELLTPPPADAGGPAPAGAAGPGRSEAIDGGAAPMQTAASQS